MKILFCYPGSAAANLSGSMKSLACYMGNRLAVMYNSYVGRMIPVNPFLAKKPKFKCTVWEDNNSCITVAKSPKYTPRSKHIAIKYHHFRSFVSDGRVVINSIDTSEQLADMLAKPLSSKSFCQLR